MRANAYVCGLDLQCKMQYVHMYVLFLPSRSLFLLYRSFIPHVEEEPNLKSENTVKYVGEK